MGKRANRLDWSATRVNAGQTRSGTQGCKQRKTEKQEQTHQALSLFPIDWSLGGGHWRAKVRGWLHERRVTEGGEGPDEVRAGVRLRHVEVGDSQQ